MQAAARLRRYKEVGVQTSSRGQLLVALYETAVRFARAGAVSIRKGDVVSKGRELQRVADIVTELTSTLDHKVAPELCQRLEQIYFYMQERLALANAMMDPEPAEEVARLLDLLREAWVEAVRQYEGGDR
jgi:flagellar protein FliS